VLIAGVADSHSRLAKEKPMNLKSKIVAGAVAGVLGATMLLTGCSPTAPQPGQKASPGSSSASSGNAVPDTSKILSAVKADSSLSAKLPANIASSKSLNIGSFVSSAPGMFYDADGKTVIGSDHDLITAVAAKLGLTPKITNLDFSALITSLQSGRVDVTIASMNDTKEREQAVDFVDYLTSGITIMVQKGNPAKIDGPSDLCGKSIAVVTGTTQQQFAQDTSSSCTADGKKALRITVTDSDSQNQTQLRTGRIDAIVNDLPTAVYVSKVTDGGNAFQVVPGDVIDGAPYGIGVNKQNPQLRDAIAAAIDEPIKDGTYGKILNAWGVSSGRVDSAVVNGAQQ